MWRANDEEEDGPGLMRRRRTCWDREKGGVHAGASNVKEGDKEEDGLGSTTVRKMCQGCQQGGGRATSGRTNMKRTGRG